VQVAQQDAFLNEILHALWEIPGDFAIEWTGEGCLPSRFAVTELASAAIGAAAFSVAHFIAARTGSGPPRVRVDHRLSSLWFGRTIRPEGWTLPPAWDAIAGDYLAADGWIRLHTNAPHHRKAALAVLQTPADKDAVTRAVLRWKKNELESAIVRGGGCAAAMHSLEEWTQHPQGRALFTEPLVLREETSRAEHQGEYAFTSERPLRGVRVLDLTRVLAGPVATRFLAGLGATVLRIDPPDWDEPNVVPEVTLGKRCARLDFRTEQGRERFAELLRSADVLVHGYRPDALEALGFGAEQRERIRQGLVDVSLDAYGWSGPWQARRGFDSLVQMSAGIADAGLQWKRSERPTPLPVQALDHATGYIMAAAVLAGLAKRVRSGYGSRARTSLARVALMLSGASQGCDGPEIVPAADADYSPNVEETAWGPLRRLRPPAIIAGTPLSWDFPASPLGSAAAEW
jgi:crotonobetainyl-CoA:carnitine CoA-transferase CaiB-like acyl-CoA transferase